MSLVSVDPALLMLYLLLRFLDTSDRQNTDVYTRQNIPVTQDLRVKHYWQNILVLEQLQRERLTYH